MKCSRLRNRGRYLEEAMLFRDTDLIKVITGVRRCGKSSLLDLIRITIESEGVAGRGFVSVNLESKGAGIGLAIVQEIVRRHHGSIYASNIPGGLCMHMTLPLLNLTES